MKRRFFSVAVLSLALPNIAQSALEEVIVTAQKREQNLQDVPMAISALARELLENNEINTVQDLTKLVPSLRLITRDDPSNSSVRIRGIGTDVYTASVEPSVSIVIDEVPLARNELASFDFLDLERIEVLRGPQGTLFGKNATAGLVHVISRDPASEFEAAGRVTYEQPDSFPGSLTKVQASASGPITDDIGLRVSVFHKEDKGIHEDVLQNNTLPNFTIFGARAKVRWDLSEDFMLKFAVDYQLQDGQATPLAARSANPDKAARSPEIDNNDEENRKVKTFGNNQSDIENLGVSLLAAWDLGATTFTSITGFRDFELEKANGIPDFAGDRVDVDRVGGFRKLETVTQEFRLSSNGDSELEYTVGTLLFNNRVDEVVNGGVSDIPADIVVRGLVYGIPDVSLPELTGDSFGQSVDTFNEIETINVGVYGQSTWHIGDALLLTAGALYIYEKMSASVKRDDRLYHDETGQELSRTQITIPTRSFDDTAITGSVSLSYDWTEETIVYGTVSTGYRAGAFDLNATDIESAMENPVDPESAFNTELGFKSRLFDNRVELNVALFRTVFEDFQAQILKLGSSSGELIALGSYQLDNAGELEAKGIEVDLQAELVDSLFLHGSLLYSDNKFNDFVTQCFVGQEPGERGGVDEDGNGSCDSQDLGGASMPHSPKVSLSVGGRYEHSFGDDQAYVAILGRWQDDTQFNTEQHPNTIQDAFAIWNIRFGWIDAERQLELAAYVNNVFAQYYVTYIAPFSVVNDRRDTSHYLNRDADRNFGLSLNYSF